MVKFNTAVFILNLLLVLFLAMIAVIPLFVLGQDHTLEFLKNSWFLFALILLALFVIDAYFIKNYRIYTLLEKEDWTALIRELEQRVLSKNRYSRRLVKILAASYLVISDARGVLELERRLGIAGKRSIVNENALIFGATRILCKDYDGAIQFFTRFSNRKIPRFGKKRDNGEWLRWYLGFSLLLNRQFDEAADRFGVLAAECRNGVITGLAAYFLSENLAHFLPRRKELPEQAAVGKARVLKCLPTMADWAQEVKHIGADVHAAIIMTYINKTAEYIYLKKR